MDPVIFEPEKPLTSGKNVQKTEPIWIDVSDGHRKHGHRIETAASVQFRLKHPEICSLHQSASVNPDLMEVR